MPGGRRTPGGDGSVAGGGGSGGGGGAAAAATDALARLVVGGAVAHPDYPDMFCQKSSARFVRAYKDYKRSLELGNAGQSVQRSLLSVSQLLEEGVRASLMRRFFPGEEPSEDKLWEALGRHGKCWEGESVSPTVAMDTVTKLMRMGSEPTAEDRIDVVFCKLEKYFANSGAAAVFRTPAGVYKKGPARVITEAFVQGLKPAGFKHRVERDLQLRDGWKSDPDVVLEVALLAAEAWTVMEQDEVFQQQQAAKGKSSGKQAASQQPRSRTDRAPGGIRCHKCREMGHKSADCPTRKPASGSGSGSGSQAGSSAARQQQRHKGQPPAKGTPAARGGSQQKPGASSSASVAGRAAVPVGAGAGEVGLPPPPVPPGGAAAGGPAGEAPGNAPAPADWRSAQVTAGPLRLQSDEEALEPPAGVAIAPEWKKSVMVEFFVPASASRTSSVCRGTLDSGSGLSTINDGIASRLQAANPDVKIVEPMHDSGHMLRMANGTELPVEHMTCPLRMSFHTGHGPVVLRPQRFAIMPGGDDVVIIGTPMLDSVGLDLRALAEERGRRDNAARIAGLETPAVLESRRVAVSIAALQPVDDVEVPDEAVERLASRGPDMAMPPAQEEQGRADALDAAVDSAAAAGLSDQGVGRLREIIDRRWGAFRRALRGDPPANVEPMRVVRKPGASTVKARPRTYNPVKTAWLSTCLATLVAMGMLFLNKQAVWASAVMATPKKQSFRMVGDYRLVNKVVEKNPGVMPNQEACMRRLGEATCYGSLDMLQGYWQMPLDPDSQEIFTIVGPGGLYTPTRVPQGVLNATSYFQATMTELLLGLNCMVWVDDVIYWGEDEEDLLHTLDLLLERLEGVGLFAAAHKCVFYDTSIIWCGKEYSRDGIKHDRERLSGLANLRRPATAGELMQWLQAVNWLRTSLPRMAEIVAPLRDFLEVHLVDNPTRTKRVASAKAIAPQAWTPELVSAWEQGQDMVANAVTLYHPREDRAVLMFPDASDEHWGSFLTQVPHSEIDDGIAVEDMTHEPLGFLSGTFRGSQLRWATVDKEGFAIVSTFRRLEYLLWGGVHIHTDHRNLAYIFNPEACVSSVIKTTAQRLENWKAVLGQYDYTIQHIAGKRNCWGDLLSRWVNVPAVKLRSIDTKSVAVFMPSTPDATMPSKQVVKAVQQASRAAMDVSPESDKSFTVSIGRVVEDDEGLYRLTIDDQNVLWIPDDAKDLQVRLMICAHMTDAGHRGSAATLHRLRGYCYWTDMVAHVKEFVKQCLHCMDSKAGEMVPRPFGETVHGTRPGEVLHFDYLHVGKSGPLGNDGLDETNGYVYLLVMLDDLSSFTWMEPTGACTARLTAQHLLTWCKTIGVPEVWVSDTATHFKNKLMGTLEKALGVERRFTVANSPWSNGTCERMMREIVRTLKAILQERKGSVRDWVDLVPAVQWALNTAYRERYGSTPYNIMFGRAPKTSFSTLASSSGGDDWKVDVLNAEALKQHVSHIAEAQTELHKEVLKKVESNRAKQRNAASRGTLPNFSVGDYVLVARVRRSGLTPKLASTWTGPWRVVTAEQKHVYSVQNIISGEVRDVHVARLRFYSDSQLEVTSELKDVFQHTFTQGEFEMEALLNIGESPDGSGYSVRVRWSGFEEDEDTWEPLRTLYEDAPQFVKQQLRKMKIGRDVREKIRRDYGIVS